MGYCRAEVADGGLVCKLILETMIIFAQGIHQTEVLIS